MGIVFARETLSQQLLEELAPIFLKHQEEIGEKQKARLEPNTEYYLRAEQLGMLRIFTARSGDSLVGYSVVMAMKSPHSGDFEAQQELLFIDKDHRKGSVGTNFIKFADKSLFDENVAAIIRASTPHRDFSDVLRRIGYDESCTLFTRRISCPHP
ncbi:MAG TPA: hypothetical protein VJA25_00235 [Dehalococcoidia bacterium]|nr:hypothetical protein [Dehalococcoidia bacterium]